MKTLVVYKSKTGFTQKYAQWIAEDLGCDISDITNVSASVIAKYDLVIHGGWIMGGMINGLEKMRAYQPKKMIVFGVGFKPRKNAELSKMVEANKLADVPFFYFEGGMRPEKMGFFGRTIVKGVTKKAPVYTDHTNRDDIMELLNTAKHDGNKS